MSRCRTGLLATALLLGAAPISRAAAPQDTASIWTLQDENSSISTNHLTDRYYTNGLRLGWTSAPDAMPPALLGLSRAIWGQRGSDRLAIDIEQSIFTPSKTQLSPPDPHDRPYAAYLIGNFSLLHETEAAQSVLSLGLGVLGPAALGQQVQNGFHDLIGQSHDRGWRFQVPNTPAIEVLAGHTWRLPVGTIGALQSDVLPSLTAAAGTLRDYAQAGAIVRIGQGLDSDFGPPRIRPGLSGADAYVPSRPFVWYVFAGADGQAVAYDATLDAGPFRGGPHVPSKWYVGEIEAGVGVIWHGVRITYVQTWQTDEFRGQKGGLFNFGSLALSARF